MEILSLGEKIKKLRKEKNLTLKELAGERITAAQISHIERDKSHTSHELLEYLASCLEVSVDYLLETKEMQAKKLTDNLIIQSEIYIKCKELEKAKEEINKVMSICTEYQLIDNYGKCNLLLATINLKQKDYNAAIINFEKSLYFFIQNDDKENIARCYINIGKIYMEENFHKGALSNFKFAEEIIEENKLNDVSIKKDLYSNISFCYTQLNKDDDAIEYIEKIKNLDIIINCKEEAGLIVSKANKLMSVGKYEEAKQQFKTALDLLEKEDNKTDLANVYLRVCEVYESIGESEKSLEYSKKAYEIKRYDEDECSIDVIIKIIQSYIKLNNFEEARKYSKTALASAIKNKNKYFEYKALKYYSEIYKKEDDNKLAIEYLLKCINIINELNDKKTLADLYIELGKLYSNISKEKELEYYQKGVCLYQNLEII
ncbi:helix-turn-helix domain-containing protein [Paraclostridium sordellii]|uniref:helix-turn-helix domain-containing protein n=1 Tax=Paraclostridium sordellii TaxID=1505 RepID=UPI0005E8259A|nr:helix-turn-helix domain-containing protein [Paeniclostridium sordellii]MBX9183077.1 helix-turn-helix domain-containing protein [Paeniclostridium sordellii]MDU6115363.1 helix-turn-helix domain-containing protein [Paeniclostridium sordellii]MRZ81853.1 helix-turn-helix domain-containing protein [Paeniclostridium sordellii]MSB59721.1 helix-turn-helix domain-containing protein [Paeniclostridium sordellii]MVO71453.1 helix-turn-helix domain-containing protein [Paeniclostridium sordellii]